MTNIEWTEETWNPITGCTKVSPGCTNCYAETMARRLRAMGMRGYADATDDKGRWTGRITTLPEVLNQPLRRKKPTTYFISMSDPFHRNVPYEFITEMFMVMSKCPQHTFQILTKRPELMRDYFEDCRSLPPDCVSLPNVWLGTSVEDQRQADIRIPALLETPAAIRFVSAEPLLEEIKIPNYLRKTWPHVTRIDWLIIGGESGPHARPFNINWARQLIAQCKDAGVAVFMKQCGSKPQLTGHPAGLPNNTYTTGLKLKSRKGGDPSEWPEDLRIREMPTV